MWAGSIDHAARPVDSLLPRPIRGRGRSCRRRGSRSSVRRSPWRRRRSRPSRRRSVPLILVIAPEPLPGSNPVTQPLGVVPATAAFSTVARVVVVAPGASVTEQTAGDPTPVSITSASPVDSAPPVANSVTPFHCGPLAGTGGAAVNPPPRGPGSRPGRRTLRRSSRSRSGSRRRSPAGRSGSSAG